MTYPWETPAALPAVVETAAPAVRSTEDKVTAIQKDLAFIVAYTAVLVHSNQPGLAMLVNTERGQIIPRGECKFTDGSTFELQDIGAPQVGAPLMSVQELMARVWDIARDLGLELQI